MSNHEEEMDIAVPVERKRKTFRNRVTVKNEDEEHPEIKMEVNNEPHPESNTPRKIRKPITQKRKNQAVSSQILKETVSETIKDDEEYTEFAKQQYESQSSSSSSTSQRSRRIDQTFGQLLTDPDELAKKIYDTRNFTTLSTFDDLKLYPNPPYIPHPPMDEDTKKYRDAAVKKSIDTILGTNDISEDEHFSNPLRNESPIYVESRRQLFQDQTVLDFFKAFSAGIQPFLKSQKPKIKSVPIIKRSVLEEYLVEGDPNIPFDLCLRGKACEFSELCRTREHPNNMFGQKVGKAFKPLAHDPRHVSIELRNEVPSMHSGICLFCMLYGVQCLYVQTMTDNSIEDVMMNPFQVLTEIPGEFHRSAMLMINPQKATIYKNFPMYMRDQFLPWCKPEQPGVAWFIWATPVF